FVDINLEDDDEFGNDIASSIKTESIYSMSHEMGSSVDEAGPSNISSSVTERLPDSGFSGTTDENQFRAPQDSQENKFVDINLEDDDEFGNDIASSIKTESFYSTSHEMGSSVDEAGPSNISSSVTERFVTPLRMVE
ncbi:uncharacterized protein LOC117121269, partial [Anneissia japonica]|uniref:uncharacterized protein LOC117121269 n=1 Tax=Anneissia japonica TaxID=1529436 RepID=UPI001425A74B